MGIYEEVVTPKIHKMSINFQNNLQTEIPRVLLHQ